MRRRAAWLGALLVGACRADPWIVAGEANFERGRGRDAGSPASPADECPGVQELRAQREARYPAMPPSPAHVGRWRGSLSGSAASGFPGTRVLLEVEADGRGTFAFESSSALAGPASAEQPYLCDGSLSGGLCGSASGLVGGFAYNIEAARSLGDVLSFVLVDADPWEPWCELQEPFWAPAASGPCEWVWSTLPGVPRWSLAGCEVLTRDGAEAIDCGRMYALERCACARDGCLAESATGVDVGLRLSAGSDELEGALWFRDETEAASLRLSRQP